MFRIRNFGSDESTTYTVAVAYATVEREVSDSLSNVRVFVAGRRAARVARAGRAARGARRRRRGCARTRRG